MNKKILTLSAILIFAICSMFFCISASAAVYEGSCGDNVSYKFDTATGLLEITGAGAMEDYSSDTDVPWCSNRDFVKTIKISDGVTSIGSYAFGYCSITSVTIRDSVTIIGDWTFAYCNSLMSVTIGDSVTSIGDRAFSDCRSLKSVTIGNSVTSIGDSAFYGCSSLKSVTISNSVTSIEDNAFKGSNNIEAFVVKKASYAENWLKSHGYGNFIYYVLVEIEEDNIRTTVGESVTLTSRIVESVIDVDSVIWTSDNESVATVQNGVVKGIGSGTTVITLSANNGDVSDSCTVTVIPDLPATAKDYKGSCGDNVIYVLYSETCKLKIAGPGKMVSYANYYPLWAPWHTTRGSVRLLDLVQTVEISDGVKSIGSYAFVDCSNLTKITIPESVTSIGDYAFLNCSSLTEIIIPASVTSIGCHAFENCSSLESITIGDGVMSIGDYAFYNCSSLTSVTIPNSVTNIGDNAFENCSSLTSVAIPYSMTSIGDYAFYNCIGLTSLTIGDGVTSIGDNAFYNCSSLTEVTIGNSVTSIGNNAFVFSSNLTSVTIGGSVTSIGERAFGWCYSLAKVTIPNSVTSIASRAFEGCSGLKRITIPNSVTSIGDWAFGWCNNLARVTIGNSVASIGNCAFEDCSSLITIEVDENNKYYCDIDGVLFTENKKMLIQYPMGNDTITYTIPDGVTNIGDSAFEDSSGLMIVSIPGSVTSIGNKAFAYCGSLLNIEVDENNKDYCDIDGVLFTKNMETLIQYPMGNIATTYTIPDSVTSIGDKAFGWCSKLTSVIIPDSMISIGDWAFSCCSGLTNIIIPDSVTSVGEWAFSGCVNLASITIGDSVTGICDYTFCNCISLASIALGDSVASIDDNAFEACSSIEKFFVKKGSYAESWLKSNGYESLISYVLLEIEEENIKISVGESVKLTSFIEDSLIDMDGVVWTSDNEGVSAVQNGVITGKSAGTAVITLSANNGDVSDSCTVTVIPGLPTTADDFLKFDGYQIRDEEYNGLRSRFVVNLDNMPEISTHGYSVIEYGTVIASSDLLDKNGDELTVFKNAAGEYDTHSYATLFAVSKNGSFVGNYESQNEHEIVYYCTITDFTAKTYMMNVEIRGYVIVKDTNGNEYVVYSDYPIEKYRSVNFKQICLEMADEGKIDTTTCISYLHVMEFMKNDEINDNEIPSEDVFG